MNSTKKPKQRITWRVFVIGVLVRLVGLALIWLGNGQDEWWAKALVVVGVAVSVLGIGVLRYLLFAPLLGRVRLRRSDSSGQETDA